MLSAGARRYCVPNKVEDKTTTFLARTRLVDGENNICVFSLRLVQQSRQHYYSMHG